MAVGVVEVVDGQLPGDLTVTTATATAAAATGGGGGGGEQGVAADATIGADLFVVGRGGQCQEVDPGRRWGGSGVSGRALGWVWRVMMCATARP